MTADYINEHFGQLQDEAYQRGLSDGKKAFDLLESERNSEYQRGLSEGNDIGYKDGVKDGQNEAWECAKKLFSTMAESDIEKAFPIEWNSGGFKALMNLQPQEAIKKLKAYEEKQKADDKIEVGDEVDAYGNKGVVTYMYEKEDVYCVMMRDGSASIRKNGDIVKTGRHFDIASILEAMKK